MDDDLIELCEDLIDERPVSWWRFLLLFWWLT
jgi:hypothetical protein